MEETPIGMMRRRGCRAVLYPLVFGELVEIDRIGEMEESPTGMVRWYGFSGVLRLTVDAAAAFDQRRFGVMRLAREPS